MADYMRIYGKVLHREPDPDYEGDFVQLLILSAEYTNENPFDKDHVEPNLDHIYLRGYKEKENG